MEEGGGLVLPPGPAKKILEGSGKVYTSSQLLEFILACQPRIEGPTILSLVLDFGAIDVDADDASSIVMKYMLAQFGPAGVSGSAWGGGTHEFALTPSDDDDHTIVQLKRFLNACHAAHVAGAEINTDG